MIQEYSYFILLITLTSGIKNFEDARLIVNDDLLAIGVFDRRIICLASSKF